MTYFVPLSIVNRRSAARMSPRGLAMNPNSYTYSMRTRLHVLFSPLRLAVFIAAIVIAVVGNVLYINNAGGPEWLGPVSVAPIWACVAWEVATDMKMRRRDRESGGSGS